MFDTIETYADLRTAINIAHEIVIGFILPGGNDTQSTAISKAAARKFIAGETGDIDDINQPTMEDGILYFN